MIKTGPLPDRFVRSGAWLSKEKAKSFFLTLLEIDYLVPVQLGELMIREPGVGAVN